VEDAGAAGEPDEAAARSDAAEAMAAARVWDRKPSSDTI
jgi:hypothetical protein